MKTPYQFLTKISNYRILFVEDCKMTAVAVKKILQKAGYDIYHVSSGDEAIELVNQGVLFELILMDVELGNGFSGIAAARHIAEVMDVPVIFFTSHSEEEIRNFAGDLNRYIYLSKLSSGRKLLLTLEKVFLSFYCIL